MSELLIFFIETIARFFVILIIYMTRTTSTTSPTIDKRRRHSRPKKIYSKLKLGDSFFLKFDLFLLKLRVGDRFETGKFILLFENLVEISIVHKNFYEISKISN